jgi:hypothetical protein
MRKRARTVDHVPITVDPERPMIASAIPYENGNRTAHAAATTGPGKAMSLRSALMGANFFAIQANHQGGNSKGSWSMMRLLVRTWPCAGKPLPCAHATLRRLVFGFKILGPRSGLIEVDVDAPANAAAMKVVSLPLLYFVAPASEIQ